MWTSDLATTNPPHRAMYTRWLQSHLIVRPG